MILKRLLEVMMMECLRGNGLGEGRSGGEELSAGLLAELVKLAGMSRSAFAAQFADVLGCSPIEYLLRWR